MAVAIAKIDSLVRDQQTVLSFRKLSRELDVPYCTAQSYLQAYVTNPSYSDTVRVLWHVTTEKNGITRSELTFSPAASSCTKLVWAVASKSLHIALPKWFEDDLAHEISLTKQSPSEVNTLRSGSYLSIVSPTAEWDLRPDPRFGDGGPPPPSARKPSSFLDNVKASKKPSSNAGKNAPKGNIFFKPKQDQSSPSISKSNLGQRSISRGKTTEPKPLSKSKAVQNFSRGRSGSKSRRIVEDESDGDDVVIDDIKRDKGTDAMDVDVVNGDDEDHEDSFQDMERRAMERERLEEEKAEVAHELRELQEEDDEPESPVLKDVDDDEAMKVKILSNVGLKESGLESVEERPKRSFRESFGLSEQRRGARRVRREVEEHLVQNGYLVTRRVMKTYDEGGRVVNEPEFENGHGPTSEDRGNAACVKFSDQNKATASTKPGEKMRTGVDGSNKSVMKRASSSKPKLGKLSNKSSKRRESRPIGSYFSAK